MHTRKPRLAAIVILASLLAAACGGVESDGDQPIGQRRQATTYALNSSLPFYLRPQSSNLCLGIPYASALDRAAERISCGSDGSRWRLHQYTFNKYRIVNLDTNKCLYVASNGVAMQHSCTNDDDFTTYWFGKRVYLRYDRTQRYLTDGYDYAFNMQTLPYATQYGLRDIARDYLSIDVPYAWMSETTLQLYPYSRLADHRHVTISASPYDSRALQIKLVHSQLCLHSDASSQPYIMQRTCASWRYQRWHMMYDTKIRGYLIASERNDGQLNYLGSVAGSPWLRGNINVSGADAWDLVSR